jgi:hypothetical protein
MRLETSEFIGSIYSYIITTAIFLINNYEKIKDGTLNIHILFIILMCINTK